MRNKTTHERLRQIRKCRKLVKRVHEFQSEEAHLSG